MALDAEDSSAAQEMIHELRNTLGLIINYAALVATDLEGRPEVKEDLEEIRNAGRRAADLVSQLSRLLGAG